MAFGRSGSRQVPIPDEPGEWMKFQRLSAVETEERTATGGDLCGETWGAMTMRERFDLCQRWLEALLVGWSYAEPMTAETRLRLDAPTLLWAYLQAVRHNAGAETPEEKKADSPPSTPISTEIPTLPVPTNG